jgi:hypothetical protein
VTVLDVTPPTLTLTPPTTEPADLTGHALVPTVVYTVSDNDTCTAPTVVQSPTAGTSVGIGNTTITVTATDGSPNHNVTTQTTILVVEAAQVTGQLELQDFVGSGTTPAETRAVTFVASTNWVVGSTTNTITLWTNTVTLTFTGDTASYILTGVPPTATALSAKTAWNLRKKLPIAWTANNTQGTANFTSTHQLPGGDLNGDNIVNFLDYSILGSNWFTTNPVADIVGEGFVGFDSYVDLYLNYYTTGDPQ